MLTLKKVYLFFELEKEDENRKKDEKLNKPHDKLQAIEWTMFGCFWTNGQICSATSRLLIHEKIADQFIARLVEETSKIRVGDPLDDENLERTGLLGPLVSKAQQLKVLGYIEAGIKEGAKLLTGGKVPPQHPRGFYVEPTIFLAQPHMTIWKVNLQPS